MLVFLDYLLIVFQIAFLIHFLIPYLRLYISFEFY